MSETTCDVLPQVPACIIIVWFKICSSSFNSIAKACSLIGGLFPHRWEQFLLLHLPREWSVYDCLIMPGDIHSFETFFIHADIRHRHYGRCTADECWFFPMSVNPSSWTWSHNLPISEARCSTSIAWQRWYIWTKVCKLIWPAVLVTCTIPRSYRFNGALARPSIPNLSLSY